MPLATWVRPDLSPAELHRQATLAGLGGKRPGRRSAIARKPRVAIEILHEHEHGSSIRKLAKEHGYTTRQVQRFVDRWKGFECAWLFYREVLKLRREGEDQLSALHRILAERGELGLYPKG